MSKDGYFGHLFLSSSIEDVKLAIESDVAAATIISRPAENHKESKSDLLKIAFDGDAVIFSDDSEKIYHKKGLKTKIKSDNTPVTNADLEVNNILTSTISSLTPNFNVYFNVYFWYFKITFKAS